MRVFFLTGEWEALKRFVRGEVPGPEGMPSVYLPWLRYKQRGYDVHVFMVGDFPKADIVDFQGCKIHLVPRPLRIPPVQHGVARAELRLTMDRLLLLFKALRLGGQYPPNIVYVLGAWLAGPGWLISRRFGSLFVKRFYGAADTYSLWSLNESLRDRLRTVREVIGWAWPSDLMVVTNDGTGGDKLAEMVGFDVGKFRHWFNGVNKHRIVETSTKNRLKSELDLSENSFVLVCLSRLTTWKRQDRIIRSMPLILDNVPNARLVVAGDGDQRETYERLAADLGVARFVRFTGPVLHSSVAEFIALADVFLQTNDRSCISTTLLEALVCGRAIVTWDVGGTRDVIQDGINGRLLPDAQPATIARAVVELAEKPELRRKLELGAEAFAVDHLQSWDERLDGEIDLIERLCAQSKKRQ